MATSSTGAPWWHTAVNTASVTLLNHVAQQVDRQRVTDAVGRSHKEGERLRDVSGVPRERRTEELVLKAFRGFAEIMQSGEDGETVEVSFLELEAERRTETGSHDRAGNQKPERRRNIEAVLDDRPRLARAVGLGPRLGHGRRFVQKKHLLFRISDQPQWPRP